MKTNTGFSLIELLITLTVIGIVTTIGIPGMNTWIKNERLTTQINSFSSHLAYARSEAMSRRQQVVMCAGPDPMNCGTDWSQGWTVFVDPDRDEKPNSSDEVLRVKQPLSGGNTITSHLFAVRFDGRGFTYRFSSSDSTSAHFTLCDDRGASHKKAIELTRTGQVRRPVTAVFPGLTCL